MGRIEHGHDVSYIKLRQVWVQTCDLRHFRQGRIVADERCDHYGRGNTEALVREVERLDWLRALELLYGERVAVEVHLYTWTAKVLVKCMVHQRAGLQRTWVTEGVTLRASAIAVMPSAV